MGYLLGPLMANVIMTELERGIVKGLFNINKFYIRYMDDTLVLMKKSNVPIVLQALDAFHKNLNFAFQILQSEFRKSPEIKKEHCK